MFDFDWNLVIFQIISSAVIISTQSVSSDNNKTSAVKNETIPPTVISHSLKLKNNNYTQYLSIENNSAIVIPEKDVDSEQIFLPLNGHNYHPDKILERLSAGPEISTHDDNDKPFDFLNFEPYIVKPLNVEYSQIFSHLQAKVLKNKNREAQQLLKESKQSIVTHKKPGLHIDTSSYHESITDSPESYYEDFQNIEVPTNQTDIYDLPTAEPPLPTTILLNTTNEIIQAIIQQAKHQNSGDQQPRTEKLVMELSPSNFSLPIGLAFFDALKSQNNPYFKSIVLQKPKKTSKIRLPRPIPTATEFTIIVKNEHETSATKQDNKDLATIAADDYPEFGEKLHPTLPNLSHSNIEDYYDDYQTITTTESPKPTTKKIRNIKKKSKSKKRKQKSKKKYYYDKNTYYPAESQRISTRIGMRNSRFIDAMKQVIKPTSGVINHSGYSTVQTYSIPKSVPHSKPIRQAAVETESTASTNQRAKVHTVKKPPPPPPKELHYFQYVNVMGKGTYNAGVGKGNEDHFIVQHERADDKKGIFQKRVRWGDKKGGFGEHYYDLNHHKPLEES